MFENILIVCVGNICRSPFTEHYLQSLCPSKKVRSAGLQAVLNHHVPEFGQAIAHSLHLDLSAHQPELLTANLCESQDLILVMEEKHIADLCHRFPQARGKVFLLGKWIHAEIPDPYRQSQEAFAHSYQLIVQACDAWQSKL